jgi:CRP/FNR family cyclic AMP-dependent transcriptional regulator
MSINLKNISLFRDLGQADLEVIAKKAAVTSFRKNVVVITEGELSQLVYFILSGTVKVHLNDENGKELILDIKGPGEYFGEMILDEEPWSASVSTVKPCQFAVISTTDLKKVMLKHPKMALLVITNLIGMCRTRSENIRSFVMLDVYGRVSKMLLGFAVEQKGMLVIPEKLTQQEMAGKVGTSREVINRIIRDLTTGGYVKVGNKRMIITKPLPSHWQAMIHRSRGDICKWSE